MGMLLMDLQYLASDLCFFVFVCVPSALCVVRRRVCYMAVVETSTISVSVVVSSTQYYSCGFWGLYTCSRLVVQYAVRIVRSQVRSLGIQESLFTADIFCVSLTLLHDV